MKLLTNQAIFARTNLGLPLGWAHSYISGQFS
jgi:hypothetical protein